MRVSFQNFLVSLIIEIFIIVEFIIRSGITIVIVVITIKAIIINIQAAVVAMDIAIVWDFINTKTAVIAWDFINTKAIANKVMIIKFVVVSKLLDFLKINLIASRNYLF
jgi:hypothetical protein